MRTFRPSILVCIGQLTDTTLWWHQSSDGAICQTFKQSVTGRSRLPDPVSGLWNTLPEEITTSQTLSTFRQHLKTWLFRKSYLDIIVRTFLIQTINFEVAMLHRQFIIDWLINWTEGLCTKHLMKWTDTRGEMLKPLNRTVGAAMISPIIL